MSKTCPLSVHPAQQEKTRVMIQLSINLPTKRRLDLTFVKDRKRTDDAPLLPSVGKIRRTKSGNKFSRYFRHIFEHKKAKRLLGMNLVALAIAASFIPTSYGFSEEATEIFIAKAPTILTTEVRVRNPLNHKKITQGYKFYHPAVDYDGVTGDPIYPIMNGKVLGVQYSRYAYGNAIVVNHGENLTSLYAHLSEIYVGVDEDVTTDKVIGTVGTTGRTSGDHLHLEIRDNGYPINPSVILP